ncbi:hypothetical protein BSF42_43700 [Flavobacterium sp. ACN6]|nr:hypothetical protein BSF42_43700 [Flavobacterium sp. ACN6]
MQYLNFCHSRGRNSIKIRDILFGASCGDFSLRRNDNIESIYENTMLIYASEMSFFVSKEKRCLYVLQKLLTIKPKNT